MKCKSDSKSFAEKMMKPHRRTWIKRIAVSAVALVALAFVVAHAGIPFIGPRHSDFKKAGVSWYRSYNGSNWLDVSLYFKFKTSSSKFEDVKRAFHLKLKPDRAVSEGTLRSFSRRGPFWFRIKWKEGLEWYEGYHETLIRDPKSGKCLMTTRG